MKLPFLFSKMVWVNDEYFYSVGVLKAIASWYDILSEVLMIGDYQITDQFALALYKADFDMALQAIGKENWRGLTSSIFQDYSHFGRLQRIVIADILGIADYELQGLGFYDIPQLRGMAYYRMVEYLNERKLPQS